MHELLKSSFSGKKRKHVSKDYMLKFLHSILKMLDKQQSFRTPIQQFLMISKDSKMDLLKF